MCGVKAVKTSRDPYCCSLARLFALAGLKPVVCAAALGCFAFLLMGSYPMEDKLYLFTGLLALGLLFGYIPAAVSVLQLLMQQHVTGERWAARKDFEKPAPQRDWYVSMGFCGFCACHRSYVRKILRTVREEEIGPNYQSYTVRVLTFEDGRGAKHRLRFYQAGEEKRFRTWWKAGGPHA